MLGSRTIHLVESKFTDQTVRTFRRWGDDSVKKIPSIQAWGPEFNHLSHKKVCHGYVNLYSYCLGMGRRRCSLRSGIQEMSTEFRGYPASWTGDLQVQRPTLIQKNRFETTNEYTILMSVLHMHKYACVHKTYLLTSVSTIVNWAFNFTQTFFIIGSPCNCSGWRLRKPAILTCHPRDVWSLRFGLELCILVTSLCQKQ